MAFPSHKPFRLTITKYELWLQRALKKEGIYFIPQAKIKTKSGRSYRVDILIPATLVVEVGYTSPIDIQEHEDLKQTGYTVLHFPNKEIDKNIQKVIVTIKNTRQQLRGVAAR